MSRNQAPICLLKLDGFLGTVSLTSQPFGKVERFSFPPSLCSSQSLTKKVLAEVIFKTTNSDLVLKLSQDLSKGLVCVYWEIALQKVEKC